MNNITKNILTGFKSVILNEATQEFPGGISEESFERQSKRQFQIF